MRRLQINFGATSHRLQKMTSLALASMLVTAVLWWRADLLDQRDRLASLHSESAQPFSNESSASHPVDEQTSRELRKISASLRYPWGAVWGALQQAQGSTVTLHLEPSNSESKRWRLTVQAPDHSSMLEFLRRLEQMPTWQSVVLESEALQVMAPGAGASGVVFQIALEWADEQ